MKNMVNDFRDYARLPPPLPAPLDLNALIAEVLDLYEDGPVPIAAELADDLPKVLADADQIRQVLHNLIKNAGEALGEKVGADGTAQVTVKTSANHCMALLAVSDNGPGFPAQILAHAFEPYVTTKPKGTGLGLAIVQKIIDDHGGAITLANRPEGGAEVSVQLPLHRDSQHGGTTA
jgi:nitrogen fixation/metabolism regulation signal transduction histidine kinase